MAQNDTAALVVALSAQVSKFEKDMQSAVSIADKHTKAIETRFTAMNSVLSSKMSQVAAGASSQLGIFGSLLSALGPFGIAAAVGLGASVAAVIALANATAEFATKSKALKENAETVGLTISQFKLLGQAGAKVGLDFDETAGFFTKFIANLGELRNGSGPLFDALLKVDTGLLRELSTTKDSVKAIDLLIAAFARLDDQTKKLDLAKAAGGRGGLAGSRLLDFLGGQGGLSGLQANSPGIDEGQIERAAKLRVEIDAIARKTANIWGGMFSDTILTNQKEAVQNLHDIVEWIDKIIGAKEKSKALDERPATLNERFGPFLPTQITINKASPPAPTGGSPSVELAILQKNISLLGEAVTQGEQWKLKRLEIAAAAKKGGIMDGIAQRALAAFNITMMAAALATRERLGIATEQQIVETKLIQLQQDKAKFGLKENEVAMATVVILREAKQSADALAVRQAYLPGLKQLELDAKNLRKGFDEVAVNSMNTFADGLTDIITRTKTVGEAFTAMANSIIRDLVRMAVKQMIIGPIAALLGLGGGGGAGGLFSLFGGGGGGKGLAGGTDNWRGGPTWVGENGPEILNLPQGSQVIPNDVVRNMDGGGNGGVTVLQTFNNTFSSGITGTDRAWIERSQQAAMQQARKMSAADSFNQQRRLG